jgi:prepilin-type N-terminal cleavage/methylation domain-containing protein
MLNIKMKDRGFTIVELLIVIVVIAILAAITIVAYNGITNRAKDTNNKTDAVSIVKVAEALNADTGSYPTGTDSATLTTSLNSGTTSKLPSGIAVTYLASSGTDPTSSATLATAADLSPHTYTVKVCGASVGLTVFYPIRATSTVGSLKAGTGC